MSRTIEDRSACFCMRLRLVAAGLIRVCRNGPPNVRLVPILVPNLPLAGSVQPSQTQYSFTSVFPQHIHASLTPASVHPSHARRRILFHAAPMCMCFHTALLIRHTAISPSPHAPFWHCLKHPGVPALPSIIGFFPYQPSYPDCLAGAHHHR